MFVYCCCIVCDLGLFDVLYVFVLVVVPVFVVVVVVLFSVGC